jgi:hypothetical protein
MGHAEEIFEQIIEKGEAAIDEFIDNRETESLFLDFKRSTNDGTGKKLETNDRKNLAKAISGFGNSEGGVIVWGVDCREGEDYADVAQAKFPLEDAKKFESWLEGAISSCTIPQHTEVKNHSIYSENKPQGYVITLIPKSNHAPHQVISSGKGQYHYYIRTGSSFSPTPHAVLSGMFGRRPEPYVFHMFGTSLPQVVNGNPPRLNLNLGLQLANGGRGIASDIFMNIIVLSSIGGGCSLSVQPNDTNNWAVWNAFSVKFTAISKTELRLPPEGLLQPFTLMLQLAPPFEKDLEIKGICGCGQSPSFNFTIKNTVSNLEKLYYEYLKRYNENSLGEDKETYAEFDFWNLKESSELASKAYKKSK